MSNHAPRDEYRSKFFKYCSLSLTVEESRFDWNFEEVSKLVMLFAEQVMRDSQYNICSGCDTTCSLVASPHLHQHRQPQDGCNFSPRQRLPSTGISKLLITLN